MANLHFEKTVVAFADACSGVFGFEGDLLCIRDLTEGAASGRVVLFRAACSQYCRSCEGKNRFIFHENK